MTAAARRRAPAPRPPPGLAVYGAVGAAALACYLNSLHGEFVHDDLPAVARNRDAVAAAPLADVFRDDFWGTPMWDPASHKSYRPLTTLTFRLNYLAWGLQPVWFHAVNVALHAAASLLFTKACLLVAGLQPVFAGLAGLLFAAHPVHAEAVAGIVGRADVLACVLFLLSFLAYHGRGGDCSERVWPSVVLAGVSMLAKETGVTVLLLNLLYDLYRSWPVLRKSLAEVRWSEESVLFSRRAAKVLMSLSVLLMFRLALLQGSLPRFSNQDNPAAFHPCTHVRFLTFCYLAAFNCWLLLCPVTLSHDWQMGSVPLVTSLADVRNVWTFLFFGCCLFLVCRGLLDFEQQRNSPLVLGLLLVVLPFLPAANLAVTVGFVVAERVLYIPSLGFVLLVVYGAQLLWVALVRQRCVMLCAGLLLLLVLCTRTVVRNRDWSSRESLIRAGLKALPHNAKMHYNFANFQRESDNLELAASHYQIALQLWPTYASAHNNLGTLMTSPGEAESHFLAAIRYSPDHVNAHYNLGQVYRRMNRSAEATRMLERCVRLDPGYSPAHVLLARLYAARGLHSAAGRLLGHLAALRPPQPDNLAAYGAWLRDRGRGWEALHCYQGALSLSPTHRASLLGAARILRTKGQWPRIHQLMIRYHVMSSDHKGGVVYTGDLYIRSPRAASASPGEPPAPPGGKGANQCLAKVRAAPRRPRTGRRKPRPWRRPLVNRTGVQPSCCLVAEFSTRVDEVGRSTGTAAAVQQGHQHSLWAQRPLLSPGATPVPVPVDGDEDFSPDLFTG
ncbi:protein O-mannosyl-transferase TMTC1-like [Bacillus rossius redtenbacheri]|uniref:protein O-mannosyl-transferase TMTC1-like n=1 Tax=Bacillus rossius redtenbacheri TaxID=93214 RepID=UPI002FDCAA35